MAINPFEPVAPAPEIRVPEIPPPATPPEPTEPVRHDDVVARVRELLGKYPTLKSRQLYDLALRMHPDLEEAGFRSFHARYVLPLKREQARAEGRITPRRKKAAAEKPARKAPSTERRTAAPAEASANGAARRARVRDVLMRLAREVAVAETRADLVDALARVEGMVDEVLEAVQQRGAR